MAAHHRLMCRVARGSAALAGLVGCRPAPPPPEQGDCTAMSAYATLRIAVTGVPAAESVHVGAAARGTAPRAEEARLDTVSGACGGEACAAGLAFHDFAPDTVAVTVTVHGRRVQRAVVPRYELWYPNGGRCAPAIRMGSVGVPAGP